MIKLIIAGQTLSIVTSQVVAGTHRYLEVEADFKGNGWTGVRKWVHFRDPGRTVHYVLPMHDDRITAEQRLDLTGGTWDVYVHGNLETDDDDLERITTQEKHLYVEGDESGNPFPPLTPGLDEILANDVEQALEIAQSVRDDADAGEFDGATFTPHVDEEGNISWTNDQGKENPEPQNIKGPKGDTGDSGVYIGTTEPTDPVKDVWINPEGSVGRVVTGIDTSGTHQPGTYDTYTLHFNEGDDLVLRVYNGADGSGIGDMVKAAYDPNNIATDIFAYADAAAAAAAEDKADTADLAAVAFSGDYDDLENTPDPITVDTEMSDSSTNPVQNKVVKEYVDAREDKIFVVTYGTTTYAQITSAISAGKLPYLKNSRAYFYGGVADAQDVSYYAFARISDGPNDSAPFIFFYFVSTANVWSQKLNSQLLTAGQIDSALSSVSTNPVRNSVITNALNQKQNLLTIDSAMSGSSTNPVQNKAIKQYVDSKIGISSKIVTFSIPPTPAGGYALLSIPLDEQISKVLGVCGNWVANSSGKQYALCFAQTAVENNGAVISAVFQNVSSTAITESVQAHFKYLTIS